MTCTHTHTHVNILFPSVQRGHGIKAMAARSYEPINQSGRLVSDAAQLPHCKHTLSHTHSHTQHTVGVVSDKPPQTGSCVSWCWRAQPRGQGSCCPRNPGSGPVSGRGRGKRGTANKLLLTVCLYVCLSSSFVPQARRWDRERSGRWWRPRRTVSPRPTRS